MASKSRISQLSDIIASNTEVLDQWFAEEGHQQPSFDANGPLLEEHFPSEVAGAKLAVEDAAAELKDLLAGPRKLVHEALITQSIATETIWRADLVHKVPLNDTEGITYSALSKQSGISESVLQKVLRHAMVYRLFCEPSPGRVAHTSASRLWATSPLMEHWAGHFLEDGVAMLPYIWKSLEQYPATDEPTQAAVSSKEVVLQGGDLQTYYSMLDKQPNRAERFGNVMTTYQQGDGFSPRHAVDGYAWGSLPDGSTIVDLGGSHGMISSAVATKYPKLNFVVQDLPETIASAPELDSKLPVMLMAHDFFRPQPVKGASVYLLRWILHNWLLVWSPSQARVH
jgi:hypothetical protein